MTEKIDKEKIKQIPPSQLRSEEEIIASWKSGDHTPLVSINCITYNHAPYIEDALIGFLRQETEFPFEILIHDDASTDATVDIIKEYQLLYPSLVKPIYQLENQYSKGVRILPLNAKRAKGKFIAICEGDDYWVCSNKLQIQIDRLKQDNNLNIIFSPAFCVEDGTSVYKICEYNKEAKAGVLNASKVLMIGGASMPTASVVFRASLMKEIVRLLPYSPVGDLAIQVICSIPNGALILNEPTVVYRKNALGSWSSRWQNISALEHLKYIQKVNSFYTKVMSDYKSFYFIICLKILRNIGAWFKVRLRTFLHKISLRN